MIRVLTSLLLAGLLAADAFAEAPRVVITTSMGEIVVELYEERAPTTVANFLAYVDEGAYDGTIFHRVIPGFMIQGGGLLPSMEEVPENATIRNEADNGLKNTAGTIAMARMDEIDSAGRQFFINVSDNEHLDHTPDSCTREQMAAHDEVRSRGLVKPLTCKSFGYAVFGHVVEGMDVVYAIEIVETGMSQGYSDVPVQTILIESVSRVSE